MNVNYKEILRNFAILISIAVSVFTSFFATVFVTGSPSEFYFIVASALFSASVGLLILAFRLVKFNYRNFKRLRFKTVSKNFRLYFIIGFVFYVFIGTVNISIAAAYLVLFAVYFLYTYSWSRSFTTQVIWKIILKELSKRIRKKIFDIEEEKKIREIVKELSDSIPEPEEDDAWEIKYEASSDGKTKLEKIFEDFDYCLVLGTSEQKKESLNKLIVFVKELLKKNRKVTVYSCLEYILKNEKLFESLVKEVEEKKMLSKYKPEDGLGLRQKFIDLAGNVEKFKEEHSWFTPLINFLFTGLFGLGLILFSLWRYMVRPPTEIAGAVYLLSVLVAGLTLVFLPPKSREKIFNTLAGGLFELIKRKQT